MWWKNAQIYHIYPLGFCGSPRINQASGPGEPIPNPAQQVQQGQELGMNTILLGPVFQSHGHGYETIDYFTVDYRLGSNADFLAFFRSAETGTAGGSGRRLQPRGPGLRALSGPQPPRSLPLPDWFAGYQLPEQQSLNDGFDYATWEGHYELVKLNHSPTRRSALFCSAP
jgi:cyclomaltodextrinase